MRWRRIFFASVRCWNSSINLGTRSDYRVSIARSFYSQIHQRNHLNGESSCSISHYWVLSPLCRCQNIVHNSTVAAKTASELYLLCKPLFYSSSSELPVPDLPGGCASIGGSGVGGSGIDSNKVYDAILLASDSGERLEDALDALGISLTTELVDGVLRMLCYEEKLAFRFFTWAGRQDGYSHEPRTYNIMIELLSSTKYKAKLFGIVCDILDYMKRNSKRMMSVDKLIEILRSYTEKHLTHLRKFAKKRRIKMKTPPETDAFNLLLDALCKCSLVNEAGIMFQRLKSKVTPNAETYNVMFFGWCRVGDPKKAMKVLEEMILRGHTPENFTYNAAIDSFCDAGLVSEARELFEFMRTEGSTISSPTAKTYTRMIVALAKYDWMDECFKLLADMRVSGCLPDVATYKEMIEGMCLAEKVDAAYKILEEMAETGFRPDILTYNCFLKVLCNLKKDEEAIKLCQKMIEAGCEPSIHTYNILITMYFEMAKPDRAIDIWKEIDRRQCIRVADTYGIMIDGLFNCGRAEDAYLLLDEIIECGIKLSYSRFDAVLLRLSEIGNLNAIHRLSEHMRRFYNVAMARRFAMNQKKKRISLRRL